MAHVENALGNRLRRIEPTDDLRAAGILDFQIAARHPVDFLGEEVIGLAPNRLAVDEGDVAQLSLARAERGEACNRGARPDCRRRCGLDEFTP